MQLIYAYLPGSGLGGGTRYFEKGIIKYSKAIVQYLVHM